MDPSLSLQFDSSNPITLSIKRAIAGDLQMHLTDTEVKNWAEDNGAITMRDVVAVNGVAFLNKGAISGAAMDLTSTPLPPQVFEFGEVPHLARATQLKSR